ncbi:MAG: cobalamin-binding protein [Nitrospira sp.]|nr:cobalamin-binding protein [Nitrospira sp.]
MLIISHFLILTFAHAEETPKRIVSLAPNITEILFALGLSDRIVGVTTFCDYPEEAKRKQKVGGISNPSLEAVVSLKPDIVVMTTDGNPKEFEERLHSLNIKTYVFKAKRLKELPNEIRSVGTTLGVKGKADELARDIEISMNKLATSSLIPHPSSLKKKVLFIVWPEPLIVAGPNTAIDDTITLLGGENIASFAKVSYPKYSIEAIIHQSPDVIIIGKGHENIKKISSRLLERLQSLPAVQNNNICYVSDNLYRLGPRIIKGIEELHECLKK